MNIIGTFSCPSLIADIQTGEEDEVFDGELDISFASLNRELYQHGLLFDKQVPEEYDLSKLTIWVDPIDGTRDFVSRKPILFLL